MGSSVKDQRGRGILRPEGPSAGQLRLAGSDEVEQQTRITRCFPPRVNPRSATTRDEGLQQAAARCARRVRRRWTKGLKVNTFASRLGFSARTHVAPACGCPSLRDARTRCARVRAPGAHVQVLKRIKSARLIVRISLLLGTQTRVTSAASCGNHLAIYSRYYAASLDFNS